MFTKMPGQINGFNIVKKSYCDKNDTNGKDDEDFINLREGYARLIVYLRNVSTLALRATRYLAYTSDVGESFRPILPQQAVKFSYAISWTYVVGDVGFHAYNEYKLGSDSKQIGVTALHAAVFQSIASMAIPTIGIHTVVHYSHTMMHHQEQIPKAIRRFGPSGLGLCCIPLLPLVDEPVEHAVDYIFNQVFPEQMKKRHHHKE